MGCLAAATLSSVVVYRRGVAHRLRDGDGRGALPPAVVPRATAKADPTLDALQPGDVILDGDADFIIEGVIHYREERDTWDVYLLNGGDTKRMLEIKKHAGSLAATFLSEAHDVPMFGALGNGLTYNGAPYTLQQRGDAQTTTVGDVGVINGGVVNYVRYAGAGGTSLVLEQRAGQKRAFFGQQVPPSTLSVYSGELVRDGTP